MTGNASTDDNNAEDPFKDADAELKLLQESVSTTRNKVRAQIELWKGRDRTYIALSIMLTYCLAIVGAILYVMFAEPDCSGDNSAICEDLTKAWGAQSDRIFQLVTTAVLPVVTLMLGFYFGAEKSDANGSGSPS